MHQAIHADLAADDTCTAAGITARGSTPVLALCRELLAQGLSPDAAMEVFRGATVALKIRSIGEAGRLELNAKGTGFAAHRAVRPASPVRQNGSAVAWVGAAAE